jgi:hypothetical protein
MQLNQHLHLIKILTMRLNYTKPKIPQKVTLYVTGIFIILFAILGIFIYSFFIVYALILFYINIVKVICSEFRKLIKFNEYTFRSKISK